MSDAAAAPPCDGEDACPKDDLHLHHPLKKAKRETTTRTRTTSPVPVSVPGTESAYAAATRQHPFYHNAHSVADVYRNCALRDAHGEVIAVLVRGGLPTWAAQKAADTLRPAAVKTSLRASIYGGEAPHSGIAGYFDYRGSPVALKYRKTAFTFEHAERWSAVFPMIDYVSALYQRAMPAHWERQNAAIPDVVRLHHSPFSTLTINSRFRTASHTDAGDFDAGYGCLACLEGEFKGMALTLDHFAVNVVLQPGDVLIFNTHHFHSNTEPEVEEGESWSRLTCVFYYRSALGEAAAYDAYSRRLRTTLAAERKLSALALRRGKAKAKGKANGKGRGKGKGKATRRTLTIEDECNNEEDVHELGEEGEHVTSHTDEPASDAKRTNHDTCSGARDYVKPHFTKIVVKDNGQNLCKPAPVFASVVTPFSVIAALSSTGDDRTGAAAALRLHEMLLSSATHNTRPPSCCSSSSSSSSSEAVHEETTMRKDTKHLDKTNPSDNTGSNDNSNNDDDNNTSTHMSSNNINKNCNTIHNIEFKGGSTDINLNELSCALFGEPLSTPDGVAARDDVRELKYAHAETLTPAGPVYGGFRDNDLTRQNAASQQHRLYPDALAGAGVGAAMCALWSHVRQEWLTLVQAAWERERVHRPDRTNFTWNNKSEMNSAFFELCEVAKQIHSGSTAHGYEDDDNNNSSNDLVENQAAAAAAASASRSSSESESIFWSIFAAHLHTACEKELGMPAEAMSMRKLNVKLKDFQFGGTRYFKDMPPEEQRRRIAQAARLRAARAADGELRDSLLSATARRSELAQRWLNNDSFDYQSEDGPVDYAGEGWVSPEENARRCVNRVNEEGVVQPCEASVPIRVLVMLPNVKPVCGDAETRTYEAAALANDEVEEESSAAAGAAGAAAEENAEREEGERWMSSAMTCPAQLVKQEEDHVYDANACALQESITPINEDTHPTHKYHHDDEGGNYVHKYEEENGNEATNITQSHPIDEHMHGDKEPDEKVHESNTSNNTNRNMDHVLVKSECDVNKAPPGIQENETDDWTASRVAHTCDEPQSDAPLCPGTEDKQREWDRLMRNPAAQRLREAAEQSATHPTQPQPNTCVRFGSVEVHYRCADAEGSEEDVYDFVIAQHVLSTMPSRAEAADWVQRVQRRASGFALFAETDVQCRYFYMLKPSIRASYRAVAPECFRTLLRCRYGIPHACVRTKGELEAITKDNCARFKFKGSPLNTMLLIVPGTATPVQK